MLSCFDRSAINVVQGDRAYMPSKFHRRLTGVAYLTQSTRSRIWRLFERLGKVSWELGSDHINTVKG